MGLLVEERGGPLLMASIFSEKFEAKSPAECSIEKVTPVSFLGIVTHQEGTKGLHWAFMCQGLELFPPTPHLRR